MFETSPTRTPEMTTGARSVRPPVSSNPADKLQPAAPVPGEAADADGEVRQRRQPRQHEQPDDKIAHG